MNTFRSHASTGRRRAGFSLIELLTVISIIGVLAALGVGMVGVASRKSKESATRAELKKLETAIASYHSEFNQYPPDNYFNGTNNPVVNQLFYELVGTVSQDKGLHYSTLDGEKVAAVELQNAFHVGGIRNAAAPGNKPRNFLANLKDSQRKEIALANVADIDLLVAPVEWPASAADYSPLKGVVVARPAGPDRKALTVQEQLRYNPWRYVSTRPRHNPSSYDLWTEVVNIKRKPAPGSTVSRRVLEVRRIGNWGEEVEDIVLP